MEPTTNNLINLNNLNIDDTNKNNTATGIFILKLKKELKRISEK
jgi:hypothetical protein